ncbi:MAG: hypothetical protein IIC59_10185 [Proteobacteria bacterium]|nr:hypothetical protein [Pseudomonadota bacterium]MCH8175537.1 hypothetical protein [Pseudomonadota bacterium]
MSIPRILALLLFCCSTASSFAQTDAEPRQWISLFNGEFGHLFYDQVFSHYLLRVEYRFIGDQWVTAEFEVYGNESIVHRIEGVTVFELNNPQLDESDPDAQRLIQQGASILLKEDYVALQAESHPTEFRTIELLPLPHR